MKRMTLTVGLFLTLFCVLSSFSTPKESEFDLYSNTSKKTQVIKIQGCDFDRTAELPKALDFRFSELYDKVDYVKLEDSEASAMGEVSSIEITQEKDFIVFDRDNKKILRFDTKGKFLNAIGGLGKAKNEYQDPTAVKYDPFNRQVAVLDCSRPRIMFYDLEGKFLHHLDFSFPFLTFGFIDKDLIILYRNEVGNGQMPDVDYNFLIYNRKGEQVKVFQPFKEMHNVRIATHTFSLQNSRLIGNEMFSPIIFTFDKTELKPLYYLDFGSLQVPKKEIDKAKDLIALRKDWMKNNDWAYCIKFFESPTKLIMRLTRKGQSLHYIADKKNPDHYVVKAHAFNDLYGKVDQNFIDYSYDNKIVYVLDSEIANKALTNIKNDRSKYEADRAPVTEADLTLLQDLSQHANPILQICTLKD